jgi:hypothetical protein
MNSGFEVNFLGNTRVPPPPPGGGGNKYCLMGKKYHENNARADKKGEKERKDKGKEKISDKKAEQEQCFIKLWETWKKCRQYNIRQ